MNIAELRTLIVHLLHGWKQKERLEAIRTTTMISPAPGQPLQFHVITDDVTPGTKRRYLVSITEADTDA